MTKKCHLVFLTQCIPCNWLPGNGYDWRQADLWQDAARVFERGKFDAVILGDGLSIPEVYGSSHDMAVKYGYQAPCHDPITTLAMMGAATSRVGLALTMSVTFYPPFFFSRVLATLDHLTRGRVAVNVVTATNTAASQNFGFDELLDHDERYDRADEYMALARALWDSWEERRW